MHDSNTTIRRAHLTDLPDIFQMAQGPEFEFPAGRPEFRRYLRVLVLYGYVFVAVYKKKVVGFIAAETGLGREMYIDLLAVEPGLRGRGIGRTLVERMLTLAKLKKSIRVVLDAPNFNAQTLNFYKKLGFQKGQQFVWFTKNLK